MTEPGFKVEGVHHGAPFRSRSAFAGYHLFGEQAGAILVAPAAARAMRTAAAAAAVAPHSRETGGLLSGRALRDGDGPYVIVSGFVEAASSSGRAAAFEAPPQEVERLRAESACAHPTADVVGWWHSHFVPSSYSGTDLAQQRMWKHPQSIGLLVFASGEPWAAAYLGPEARKLGRPTRVPTSDAASERGPQASVTENGGDGHPTPPAVLHIPSPPGQPARQPGAAPTPRQYGLIRLVLITLALFLLLFVFLAVILGYVTSLSSRLSSAQQALSGQILSGQDRLGNQLHRTLAGLGPPPSISSSCVSGARSAVYRCTATTSGPPGRITWWLDGKARGTGSTVTIRVPKDGRAHQIRVSLGTSAGSYPGVPQTIPPTKRGRARTTPASGGTGG